MAKTVSEALENMLKGMGADVHVEGVVNTESETGIFGTVVTPGGGKARFTFTEEIPVEDRYRRGSKRVEGSATVGDIVGYEDVANIWEPHRVEAVNHENLFNPYKLVNLVTGATHSTDLRQHGWTFAKAA